MSDRNQNLKRKLSTSGRNIPGYTEPAAKLSKSAKKRQKKKTSQAEKDENKIKIDDASNIQPESNDNVVDGSQKEKAGGGLGARQQHQRVQGRDYKQQQGHHGGYQPNHNQQAHNHQRGRGYSGRGNNMNRGGGYAQSNQQGQRFNYVAPGQPMVQHDKPYGPRPPPQYTEYDVSKELVRIVRHGKYNWQIPMDAEGYVFVNDILNCKRFYDQFPGVNQLSIEKIVESNDKKLFELVCEEGVGWKIKAAQGHTVKVENRSLRPITNPKEFPVVIHGTYWENWEFIKVGGLNRMRRNHIHFAPGLPNEVVSGMKKSCEVAIYIDMVQALKDGFKFFQSSNQVILTEGDEKGRIHPKYFLKVVQLYPRKGIEFEIPPEYSEEKNKSNEKPKQVKGN